MRTLVARMKREMKTTRLDLRLTIQNLLAYRLRELSDEDPAAAP